MPEDSDFHYGTSMVAINADRGWSNGNTKSYYKSNSTVLVSGTKNDHISLLYLWIVHAVLSGF